MSDDEAALHEEVRSPSSPCPKPSRLTTHQRLKSALWYSIGQFVDDKCLEQNLNATPQFIGALTELVWTQICA
jgi:hypothetical protein